MKCSGLATTLGKVSAELNRIAAETEESVAAADHKPDAVHDASETIHLVRELRAMIEQGDGCYALIEAYRLGRLVERLQVRAFEHPAMIGRRKSRKSELNAKTQTRNGRQVGPTTARGRAGTNGPRY